MKALEIELRKREQKDDEDCDTEDDCEVKNTEIRTRKNSARRPSSAKAKKTKFVEDFNLLDIPARVNLKPLFDEFIIPMIPEGFGINFKTKSLFDEGGKDCFVADKPYTINKIVHQTEQPKSLVFTYRTRKILKIVRRSGNISSEEEKITNKEDDDDDGEKADADEETRANIKNVYLLSEFIKELEELSDMQRPPFDRKIDQIKTNLAKTNNESSKAHDRNVNSTEKISLSKRNSKNQMLETNEADSDADSDTDNEEIERENEHRSMIDSKFKSANFKRCFGRWSTRDIHDTKFNEEKLTVQFRTGRLGFFGLATNRFSNFPYQSWDFKPEFKSQ